MTSNCNTIVRRDVTLEDLVPGAVIYRKDTGHRKIVSGVSKICVYYRFGGYDYIHHPKYGVLVNYEIEDDTQSTSGSGNVTKTRRPVTREDLRPGLVMYSKRTNFRKLIRGVSDSKIYFDDGGVNFIDGDHGVLKFFEVEVSTSDGDEVDQLIESRSNGTYAQISNDASKIIDTLGTSDNFAYFYSQIANKLARIKHGYSVEDSLLDIAGYAKLELEKLRDCE